MGMLATCVGEHWEEYVNKACMAYNMSVHATTEFTLSISCLVDRQGSQLI